MFKILTKKGHLEQFYLLFQINLKGIKILFIKRISHFSPVYPLKQKQLFSPPISKHDPYKQ
ncbi:hypothetical protein BpHYR1_020123 [Brachionus plicatilis]|uniref:Uncharacterized protein n=1 Tax=Brachionus plicatilis TaxID=10195 RepID=A0A3M7RXJ3_BRAPC|nr:hypothetical protein BpHYR1_020123 [Brachionus plicatilis]